MYHRIKNNVLTYVSLHRLNPGAILFLIIGIAFFAFSIKTLNLGYFNDDWHHIYYAYENGVAGLKQFLFFDSRPLGFLVYGPIFPILGFKAFNWHLAVLILRLLTVLLFWVLVNMIWPDHQKENGLVAALFLGLYQDRGVMVEGVTILIVESGLKARH